jgi:hypothetical protein
MPLLCPDILDYIKGREEVCKIVLSICQHQGINTATIITLHSNLFTTLGFTKSDIVCIIQKAGQHLSVRFSYSLLIQIESNCTVEELATLLWKFMCRMVKYS